MVLLGKLSISALRNELQFLTSSNVGLFSGGRHLTAFVILQFLRIRSSFDEIDTGVSGEVSNKIAAIMQKMSNNMQVIAITHLPQIAAKGSNHYKVYKEEIKGITTTNLKQLSSNERIVEIAEMLSGKDISDSALTHAKELLN